MFTVIPAIDLKDGRCVRLSQGRADKSKVYSADPVETAQSWQKKGARLLHVVDLDGAFSGKPVHTEVILRIADALDIPVEVGGGLRTNESMDTLIRNGVARVIAGTRLLTEPDSLERLVSRFGDKLVAGIDARDGMVQVEGWVKTTKVTAVELARTIRAAGAQRIIYTDTATDGMMKGVNIAAMGEMCSNAGCPVIASGGVTGPADIRALAGLGMSNLEGAIVGKALYEGITTLEELSAAADESERNGA